MDLVLHIGFAKCASSTLQNNVFMDSPGYLGAGKGIPKSLNFGKQFQHHCPLGGRTRFDRVAAINWRDRVLDFLSDKGKLSCCILSNENLSSASAHNPMPIVAALDEFAEEVWTTGKVKVVLVLRNQIDRLGSLYSQFSQARFNAGQADFEQFVSEYLRGKKLASLHYADWVEGLQNTLGRENVLILLLEDIQKIEFWSDLAAFCGLHSMPPEQLKNKSFRRRNVSSMGNHEWKVRPLDLERKARAITKQGLNRVMSAPRQKGKEHRLFKPLFPLVKSWNVIQARIRERSRSEKVAMNDCLMKLVRDNCAENNRKLEMLLGRELSGIGYPIGTNDRA